MTVVDFFSTCFRRFRIFWKTAVHRGLGGFRGGSWVLLEALGGLLGSSWGPLGGSWGPHGGVLGGPGASRGRLGSLLGASWGALGTIFFGDEIEVDFQELKKSLQDRLRTVLEPSWADLGPS